MIQFVTDWEIHKNSSHMMVLVLAMIYNIENIYHVVCRVFTIFQVLLCFGIVAVCLYPFKFVLLALGQSYDCPSASETTLKDMGK